MCADPSGVNVATIYFFTVVCASGAPSQLTQHRQLTSIVCIVSGPEVMMLLENILILIY